MLKAVNIDGCNVIGYSAWSLLDGWEWAAGNTVTFGVHHVDLGDPLRKRTPRASAKFLGDIFQKNGFLKD
jgi:lactase-phlorizin hydrolase